MLFAEAARSLDFGARIISGYLFNLDERLAGSSGPGSTHAWAEVYVPGAGWISFDPTNRGVGDSISFRSGSLATSVRSCRWWAALSATAMRFKQCPSTLRSRAVPGQAYPHAYPAWVKKLRQSAGWISWVAMAQALQRPSIVRRASLRKMFLNLAKACSIGSRSGL